MTLLRDTPRGSEIECYHVAFNRNGTDRVMKAMILAAGYGRRMQPLTFQMPKPVIPVLGRPLIQQVLAGLGSQGIREATVNLHHPRRGAPER
jgi:NDP-sugar pyrophosphorylase family protein